MTRGNPQFFLRDVVETLTGGVVETVVTEEKKNVNDLLNESFTSSYHRVVKEWIDREIAREMAKPAKRKKRKP